MFLKPIRTYFLILILGWMAPCIQAQSSKTAPRTIVTTDGEIDDVDSFIRMLLYANEYQIEGLIYSSSMWHYKGDGMGTTFTSEMEMTRNLYGKKTHLRWPGTAWMQELISEYDKIQPNLTLHADGFPTAEYLKTLIKVGNIDFEGEMEKDTEGSDFIKTKLLDDNMAPLYLQVWGGTNTIARALKSIEKDYKNSSDWERIYDKVCNKAILYAILDQDATYKKYISPNWPDLKILYNSNQFWCLAYPWKRAVPQSQHYLLEGTFMGNNIIHGHGPLLKNYYSYGDGQKQEGDDEHIHGDPSKLKGTQWGDFGKYDFISEGDSPAFLHLIDVGLNNIDHPEWGGWGGRLVRSQEQPNRWEDGELAAEFNPYTQQMDPTYPQIRWLEAIQHDFAARADWCTNTYENANHPPLINLTHPNTIVASAGETVVLGATASDPDGDGLTYSWWQYKEVDTYNGEILLQDSSSAKSSFIIPKNAQKGDTIHIVLEVSDTGEIPLTRYQRVIVVVA